MKHNLPTVTYLFFNGNDYEKIDYDKLQEKKKSLMKKYFTMPESTAWITIKKQDFSKIENSLRKNGYLGLANKFKK